MDKRPAPNPRDEDYARPLSMRIGEAVLAGLVVWIVSIYVWNYATWYA